MEGDNLKIKEILLQMLNELRELRKFAGMIVFNRSGPDKTIAEIEADEKEKEELERYMRRFK